MAAGAAAPAPLSQRGSGFGRKDEGSTSTGPAPPRSPWQGLPYCSTNPTWEQWKQGSGCVLCSAPSSALTQLGGLSVVSVGFPTGFGTFESSKALGLNGHTGPAQL